MSETLLLGVACVRCRVLITVRIDATKPMPEEVATVCPSCDDNQTWIVEELIYYELTPKPGREGQEGTR